MSKDRDDERNTGMPGEETFSLEEILAEFGGGAAKPRWKEDTIPFPVTPRSQRTAPSPAGPPGPGKVVSFPAGRREAPPPAPPPQPEPEEPPEDGDKVLEFPGEEGPASDNPIAEGLNRLFQKADDYAGHMFEEEGKEDDEEVRRAEEYIPGTDEEEPEEVFRERRPRRQPPPAPDLPAAELARRYGKGLKSMGVRSVLVFLLLLPALYLTLGLFPYPAVLTPELRVLALAGIQGAAMLLGLDVLMRGLFRLLRLELGMDTLLVFAAAATLADALTMYRLDPRDGQMPYCAAIVLGIFFLLRGARRKRRGLRMACRTAASAAQPYLVTLDEGKWNGWDTYAKWSGEPIGFGRQMQAADGAERIFHRVCPLLFIACLLLSVVASIGRGAPERLVPVRHAHRLRLPVRGAVLRPAVAEPYPAAEQVGGRHRRVGRGHCHGRQRHPAQRYRLFPAGLRVPQRHQDLWGLSGGQGGVRHRHPYPGRGLRAGQALPRPAPRPGVRVPPRLRLLRV